MDVGRDQAVRFKVSGTSHDPGSNTIVLAGSVDGPIDAGMMVEAPIHSKLKVSEPIVRVNRQAEGEGESSCVCGHCKPPFHGCPCKPRTKIGRPY